MSVGPSGPGFPSGGPQGHMPHMPGSPLPQSPYASDIHAMRPERPSVLTAAAVVGFVTAGFEIIGGLLWILGGSVVDDAERTLGTGTDAGAVIMVFGLLSLIVGGVYIWGGVVAMKCKTAVLWAAAGVGVVANIVALILFNGGLLSLALGAVVLLLLALSQSQLKALQRPLL